MNHYPLISLCLASVPNQLSSVLSVQRRSKRAIAQVCPFCPSSSRAFSSPLARLAMETIDLSKDEFFMRNHLGQMECKLCLTLHPTEGVPMSLLTLISLSVNFGCGVMPFVVFSVKLFRRLLPRPHSGQAAPGEHWPSCCPRSSTPEHCSSCNH